VNCPVIVLPPSPDAARPPSPPAKGTTQLSTRYILTFLGKKKRFWSGVWT